MNYWIFTVTSHDSDGRVFSGEEVFQQRMADKFWGLGEKTPNRKSLQKGDQVVFYVGNPIKSFAGSASLSGPAFELSLEEQEKLSHGTRYYRAVYGVYLESGAVWNEGDRRPVEALLPALDFIENKESWGSYFQGGIRWISEKDYRTILQGVVVTGQTIGSTLGAESASEFALETHLEDFLDRNWENIDFGAPLEKYGVEDQTGRQFPAGAWSIDFLCVDKQSGDFVVIELKRGKTSDTTVGQILRYVAYVKKNLAKPNQSVRGIIIAREVDEALRYAIEAVDNITVLTYRVDFKLSRVS